LKICLIGNTKSIHFKRWAVSLHKRGLNVCTYSINRDKGFDDIPNYRFDYHRVPLFNSAWKNHQFLKFLERIDADIFHMHFLRYFSHMKQVTRTEKYMVTPYGSEIFYELSSKQKELKRILIENAKLVTASSKFLLNAIVDQGYKIRDKKLIYFGVDRNLFRPLRTTNPKKFRIGFAKHLESHYGVEELIRAVEILARKGQEVELYVYGEGDLKERLLDYILSNKLEQHIFLFGAVDHESLPEIYNQFSVFAMPSTGQESFGVAAIEAQACGIPVIASNTGGIPEAVLNGETGILTEPGNINQIAEAIETLLDDEELRIKMGKNAVEWSKNFDWENSVSEMIDAYDALR
jgi:glycosyltransferase involved in cell wall biosynthesis